MPSHIPPPPHNWVSHCGLEPNTLMLLSLLNGNEAGRVKDSLNEIKCSLWIEPLSYDLSTSSLWGSPFENYCQRLHACFYTEMSDKSFWSWPSFVFSWKNMNGILFRIIMPATCICFKCWVGELSLALRGQGTAGSRGKSTSWSAERLRSWSQLCLGSSCEPGFSSLLWPASVPPYHTGQAWWPAKLLPALNVCGSAQNWTG